MKERKDKKMQHILESLFLDTALPFRVRLFNILAIHVFMSLELYLLYLCWSVCR